jgi:nucleoside-diphosphate-sugar epimerase
MRIAILGATSQIAKDIIISCANDNCNHDLVLFARKPDLMSKWLLTVNLNNRYRAHNFSVFNENDKFDAIINFVGICNSTKVIEAGVLALDITQKYDDMALSYIKENPSCKYIFISSGAVYGSNFNKPVEKNTMTTFSVNSLKPQDWYGVAKFYAECKHRALSNLSIVDVRIFSYFSHTQNITSGFLITDIVHSIKKRKTLKVSSKNIVRDYIGPSEIYQIISLVLKFKKSNKAIDCYTKLPIDKITLLKEVSSRFKLKYELIDSNVGINATGLKSNYFSKNNSAELYGYKPSRTSLEVVLSEVDIILNSCD